MTMSVTSCHQHHCHPKLYSKSPCKLNLILSLVLDGFYSRWDSLVMIFKIILNPACEINHYPKYQILNLTVLAKTKSKSHSFIPNTSTPISNKPFRDWLLELFSKRALRLPILRLIWIMTIYPGRSWHLFLSLIAYLGLNCC